MCVERLRRRKTSVVIHRIIYYIIVYIPKSRGPPGSRGGRWPRKTPPGTCVNVPACSGPGRQPLKWGAVAGHCSDSPWAPSCAAGMSL